MDYPNRLQVLNITTLETRRLRADLLEVFNIFNRLESILPADFFDTNKAWYQTRAPNAIAFSILRAIYSILTDFQ